MTKPGDFVTITTDTEKIEGVLLESPELEKNVVIVKLESGYNLGIDKKKVKKIIAEVQPAKKIAAPAKQEQKKGLPKISILHTGGTIASKVDYRTGGVISKFTPDDLLQMFPEMKQIANVESRLIANMWSEDLRFANINKIAQEIAKEAKKGIKGIIVTHGTDLMHSSSAGLAFILDNIGIPVILVGAQRSSDRASSDARQNLLAAANFIVNTDFAGIAVCMHENMSDDDCLILPATKMRKMHTSRRDAFRPINTKPIARVKADGSVHVITTWKKPTGIFTVKPLKEVKVGMLYSHTNLLAEEVLFYKNFDALLIVGTALGHTQINAHDELTAENKNVKAAIETLAKIIPVAMCSQSLYGRTQMNVYQTGRDLQAIGVIGHGHDMTPETAYIKLAWLLSNYTPEETKKLFTENLRGEISERTENNFLI